MPLSPFVKGATRVAELCDLLEALADDLPRKAPAVWREAVHLTVTVLPEHLDQMSSVLLPVLASRTEEDTMCKAVLGRLVVDYEDSRSGLSELTELLENAMRGQSSLPSEALGFALRAHFEAIRRQIGWETEVILPLAKRCFTNREIEALLASGPSLNKPMAKNVLPFSTSPTLGNA